LIFIGILFNGKVDDTNEVAEAKANFYQLFEEAR
jgi:hypothetical protein